MKKGVILAIIVGIVALVLLLYFNVFNGYVISWSEKVSGDKMLRTCSDSDLGKDYKTGGIVTWTFRGRPYKYEDKCTIGMAGFLTEYSCDNNKQVTITSYNCAKTEGTKGVCKNDKNGAYCE
ncbi:MAG: hypothetical protein AABW73_01005 [Nanoarchaeota archaeon]|mgnify:CR=1 FL=1